MINSWWRVVNVGRVLDLFFPDWVGVCRLSIKKNKGHSRMKAPLIGKE